MITRNPTAVWIHKRKGKRGVSYRLRWINPRTGNWESEACGRDMAYARQRREQVRHELREGLSGKLPHTTVRQLLDMSDSLMAGRSPQTIESTKASLRRLDAACSPGCISAIDRAAVMTFRAKRLKSGASPATVNKDLREIRSVLSYAMDAGLLRNNPLLRWKGLMVREPEKSIRVVEADEFAKLTDSCEHLMFKVLIEVAFLQGLRRGELINLRWTAVDLDRRILHVVNVPEAGELTKSRKNRSLPMHPVVHTALSQLWDQTSKVVENGAIRCVCPHVFCWPDGRPLKRDWASREFAKLVDSAGVSPCTIHDLRRSFSTLAQRAGVDKYTVKDLGGWSVVSVVKKHYSGELSEVYRRAMNKIAHGA